jgi:two-component system sensor histidine kinase PilS (NtrC family)
VSWLRLLTALLALAAGALLQYRSASAFDFPLFALAISGAAVSSLALFAARGQDLARLAWLQVLLDSALITAIVVTSGGPRSLFTFLYAFAVIEACVVVSRTGALAVAGVASVFYLTIVLVKSVLPGLALADRWEPTEATAVDVLSVFLNAAVLLVIAVVAGSLVEKFRRTQEHLETQHKRVSDLQAFRNLIFDSVGSGLIAVDLDGRITAFNRAAEAISGLSAMEALGQPWETVLGPDIDLDEVRRAVTGHAGQSQRQEIQIRRADGRQVPVGITFWLLRSGEGEVDGLIGVCQDLSYIKQMEERVRQADRLATVGRLAANIAHEIRNPLASVSGAIEVLVKELPAEAGRTRLVDIVVRESERLNAIINGFLDYARPAPPTLLDVNLAEVLDEVLLLIEHRPLPETLKVMREYPDALPARVDPQQVRQALWNLCINAVQALPEGGEVRVSGRRVPGDGNGRIEVAVADTGQGIAPADLPHIFEPFYSTKPEGSGLGLALVYRVIQDHGGHIEVRSQPGLGTTFTLALPAARREP